MLILQAAKMFVFSGIMITLAGAALGLGTGTLSVIAGVNFLAPADMTLTSSALILRISTRLLMAHVVVGVTFIRPLYTRSNIAVITIEVTSGTMITTWSHKSCDMASFSKGLAAASTNR